MDPNEAARLREEFERNNADMPPDMQREVDAALKEAAKTAIPIQMIPPQGMLPDKSVIQPSQKAQALIDKIKTTPKGKVGVDYIYELPKEGVVLTRSDLALLKEKHPEIHKAFQRQDIIKTYQLYAPDIEAIKAEVRQNKIDTELKPYKDGDGYNLTAIIKDKGAGYARDVGFSEDDIIASQPKPPPTTLPPDMLRKKQFKTELQFPDKTKLLLTRNDVIYKGKSLSSISTSDKTTALQALPPPIYGKPVSRYNPATQEYEYYTKLGDTLTPRKPSLYEFASDAVYYVSNNPYVQIGTMVLGLGMGFTRGISKPAQLDKTLNAATRAGRTNNAVIRSQQALDEAFMRNNQAQELSIKMGGSQEAWTTTPNVQKLSSTLQNNLQKSKLADAKFLNELGKTKTDLATMYKFELRSGMDGITRNVVNIAAERERVANSWAKLNSMKYYVTPKTKYQVSANNRYLKKLAELNTNKLRLTNALAEGDSILAPRYDPYKGLSGVELKPNLPSTTAGMTAKQLAAFQAAQAQSLKERQALEQKLKALEAEAKRIDKQPPSEYTKAKIRKAFDDWEKKEYIKDVEEALRLKGTQAATATEIKPATTPKTEPTKLDKEIDSLRKQLIRANITAKEKAKIEKELTQRLAAKEKADAIAKEKTLKAQPKTAIATEPKPDTAKIDLLSEAVKRRTPPSEKFIPRVTPKRYETPDQERERIRREEEEREDAAGQNITSKVLPGIGLVTTITTRSGKQINITSSPQPSIEPVTSTFPKSTIITAPAKVTDTGTALTPTSELKSTPAKSVKVSTKIKQTPSTKTSITPVKPPPPTTNKIHKPPPETPPPEPPPPFRLRLRPGMTEEEKRVVIAAAGGAFTWQQGELNNKKVHHVVVNPFEQSDKTTVLGRPPKGAKQVSGKGQSKATLKLLHGEGPKTPTKYEGGAIDPVVSSQSKRRVIIRFVPDRRYNRDIIGPKNVRNIHNRRFNIRRDPSTFIFAGRVYKDRLL